MDDIYQNRVSYNHDGSNSLKDRFTFTVADGTNLLFVVDEGGKEIVTAAPQKFKIDILPVDDGTPRIVTNLGLQWLEYMENKATNLITKKELLTMDPDTDDGQLVYQITTEPKHGFLESKSSVKKSDINLGLVRYVLHEETVQETMDNFKFLVKDSKPNVVSDNVFHIQWSLISFEHQSYNVSEKAWNGCSDGEEDGQPQPVRRRALPHRAEQRHLHRQRRDTSRPTGLRGICWTGPV
ncbi:hypothetical protein fugu_004328 [Takifugu bimaculatus]|uniref:Cadherin domain-containing protein n=1 Tax=Takifugu bimaculatus TaxID=433685 RepID=A0A4Z2BCD8_9TELE|nr:hypothetical protein fugu_004328 [Takifugu bimaculatus]